MVETADARTFYEFLGQVANHQGSVFRGQSKEYPAITPSLFRLPEPLDLKPLLKAADDLYMTAHKVIEAMLRLREADQYYARAHRASDYWDDEEQQGVFGRLQRWLANKIFALPDRDDDDDGINFMNLPIGSGMGTNESYSKLSKYYWSRVPSERLSMAMLQHYGAPSGTLDVSFDRRVAFWFACHSYVRNNGRASYKLNTDRGVVYVMDIPDGHLIDIRGGDTIDFDDRPVTIPLAGMRGWRQDGGLVFGSTMDDSDLTRYVVKKINIAPGAFDQNDDRLKLLTQQRLFPSPDEDDFYRELLRAKDSTDEHTRQLAAFIPLYVIE